MVAAYGVTSCFETTPNGMLCIVKSESYGMTKKVYSAYCINAYAKIFNWGLIN